MDIQKKKILLFGIFVILGVIFLIMGINMEVKNNELKEVCTGEVQGIVSDFHVSGYYGTDEDGIVDERLYYPIFEYEIDNKKYSKQSPTGKREERFELGESIVIMYNPDNPDEYYVPADVYAAKTGGLNIGFGIFMIAFIAVLVVVDFIKNKK